MTDRREPLQHPEFRVNLPYNYVTHSVQALLRHGLDIDRSWLDPSDPRDATIVLGDSRALVWDEVTGWRVGGYLSGRPGVRTTLTGAAYLGGGVLPSPAELASRVAAGTTEPWREHRSYTDADGIDEALRAY